MSFCEIFERPAPLDEEKIKNLLIEGLPGAEVVFDDDQKSGGRICKLNIIKGPICAASAEFILCRNHVIHISLLFVQNQTLLQKQGVGKKILSNLAEVAQEIGTRKMTVEAREIGSYLWARIGFMPIDYDHNLLEAGSKRVHRLNAPDDEKEALQAIIFSGNPQWIYDIARSAHGAEILCYIHSHSAQIDEMVNGYSAELDWTDNEVKTQFLKYVTLSKEQEKAVATLLEKVGVRTP